MMRKLWWPLVVVVILLLAGTVLAQGGDAARTLRVLNDALIPVRDAPELAERLGGVAGATSLVLPPSPPYAVGDRLDFFVGNGDDDSIFTVHTVLAAATPGVYLWVEDGVRYDAERLQETAQMLDEELFPAVRALFGSEPTPGIDGDPHIYIVNATGLGAIGGYFNDGSTYPQAVISSSNQHEMFVIAIDNISLTSADYPYVLAHEFVHMIQHNEDMNEETWVIEGTAELGAFLAVGPRLYSAQLFLSDPTLQLTNWDLDNRSPHYGSAALFFSYLVDRFGDDFALIHSQEAADGIVGIDRALAALGVTDPASGEPVTFDDVFAD
ncbi:MAG: hypothetical protein JW910_06255, partial [Anaerolineae bacterium]|nr:hypothetical protein [Anaerolineae bacterium]